MRPFSWPRSAPPRAFTIGNMGRAPGRRLSRMRNSDLLAVLLLAASFSASRSARCRGRCRCREPGDARVIVKFKDDASVLRAHALSARRAADRTRALERRARRRSARARAWRCEAGAADQRARAGDAGPDGHDAPGTGRPLALDPEVEYGRARSARSPHAGSQRHACSTRGGANGPAVGQWYLNAPAGEVASSIDAVSRLGHHDRQRQRGRRRARHRRALRTIRIWRASCWRATTSVSDRRAAIANDGNGRDDDPSDPGDWVTQPTSTPTTTFGGCERRRSSWHGTQVAGIIGAATDNGIGMAGAGWNVRVLPVRVLGKCFGYTSTSSPASAGPRALPCPACRPTRTRPG